MKTCPTVAIFLIYFLINSIQCQSQQSQKRLHRAALNHSATAAQSQPHGFSRQQSSWSNGAGNNNPVSTIVTRINTLEENINKRLATLGTQQADMRKHLESIEQIQRLVKTDLENVRDNGESFKDFLETLEKRQNELDANRFARQIDNLEDTNRDDAINTDLDVSAKLDSLSSLLLSVRLAIAELATNTSKVIQHTGNIQRRFNNLYRRKNNGQAYLPPHSQTAVATAPEVETQLPSSCSEGAEPVNGILKIQVNQYSKPFYVLCSNAPPYDGEWTVIMKRVKGVLNFRRGWEEYKAGFGNLAGEFFIGLEKLHALTASKVHELLVILEDFEGVRRFAKYNLFAIGDESELYAMNLLGAYEGDAGDSLGYHAGSKFSTFDNDNDGCVDCNCAQSRGGGWWYNWCATSNLMGQYYQKGNYSTSDDVQNGIFWNLFRPASMSLARVEMMIRPADDLLL